MDWQRLHTTQQKLQWLSLHHSTNCNLRKDCNSKDKWAHNQLLFYPWRKSSFSSHTGCVDLKLAVWNLKVALGTFKMALGTLMVALSRTHKVGLSTLKVELLRWQVEPFMWHLEPLMWHLEPSIWHLEPSGWDFCKEKSKAWVWEQ